MVTITANDPLAGEPANDGQFTVAISNPSDVDTVIAYTVSGDAIAGNDFAPLSNTVTIAAGQSFATIDILVFDDAILEHSETVTDHAWTP